MFLCFKVNDEKEIQNDKTELKNIVNTDTTYQSLCSKGWYFNIDILPLSQRYNELTGKGASR